MAPSITPEKTTRDIQARTGSVPARAIRRRAINVGGAERWLSIAAGALVALWATGGRRRRLTLGTASALLLERGLTGSCPLYRAMGVNTVTGMPRDGWREADQARRELLAEARRTITRTVTIGRPRPEVGAALRDVSRWPAFADLVQSVEVRDRRTARLLIGGANGQTEICDVELDEDLPDATLAWRVFNEAGHAIARIAIGLADAPAGRGTEVRLSAIVDGPDVPGALASGLAKLRGQAPEQQARRVLRRLKQLLETGEVISAAGPSGRRASDPVFSRVLRTRTDARPRVPRRAAAAAPSPTGGI